MTWNHIISSHEYRKQLYCSNFNHFIQPNTPFFLSLRNEIMPPFIFAQVQYLKRLVSQIHSTRVVRLLMYFAMAMITLKWNGWQLLNFHKHIIYCLENAFSKITFKSYRLFSGILMINTRKHNKINACNKPDFTTFEWQTRI